MKKYLMAMLYVMCACLFICAYYAQAESQYKGGDWQADVSVEELVYENNVWSAMVKIELKYLGEQAQPPMIHTIMPNQQRTYSSIINYQVKSSDKWIFVVYENEKKLMDIPVQVFALGTNLTAAPLSELVISPLDIQLYLEGYEGFTGVNSGLVKNLLERVMRYHSHSGLLPDIAQAAKSGKIKHLLEYFTIWAYDMKSNAPGCMESMLRILSGDTKINGVFVPDLNEGEQAMLYELFFIVAYNGIRTPQDVQRFAPYIIRARESMGQRLYSNINEKYGYLLDHPELVSGSNSVKIPVMQSFGTSFTKGECDYELIDGVYAVARCNKNYLGVSGSSISVLSNVKDYDINVIDEEGFSGFAGNEIILPDTITIIGDRAFSMCTNIQEITLPRILEDLGEDAFEYCLNLTNIKVATGSTRFRSVDGVLIDTKSAKLVCYPSNREGDTYQVPEGIKTIGTNAFFKASRLKKIILPDSITTLEERAITGCTELTEIVMPDNVQFIGDEALSNNYHLEQALLPQSIQYLGAGIFDYTNISTVRIPDSLPNYSSQSFNTLFSPVASVYVDEGSNFFLSTDGVLFSKDQKTLLCYPPQKSDPVYKVPEGVNIIAKGAFANNKFLTQVLLPNTLTMIQGGAFKETALTSITFPSSLTVIEGEAFSTTPLSQISFPDNLRFIGPLAFKFCTGLTEIELLTGLETIGNRAFAECRSLSKIHIPPSVSNMGRDIFAYCNPTILGEDASYAQTYAQENNLVFMPTSGANGIPVGMSYSFDGNDIIITTYSGDATQLTVPMQIEGRPVTAIGDWAFYGLTGLQSVTLPTTVTQIGTLAFGACSNLTEIRIDGQPQIAPDAFDGCPDGLEIISH